MSKVLIIQNTISHYRVPIYNLIADKHDVDVIYGYGDVPCGCRFNTIHMPIKNVWKITFFVGRLPQIARQYDVVIAMLAPLWGTIVSMTINPFRKYKMITWGIGVPASYSIHYDDSSKSLLGYKVLIKCSDATIFYSDYPKEKYQKIGFQSNKLFVAHNTVKVEEINSCEKNIFLFIGSLYKAKGIEILLKTYQKAKPIVIDMPKLIIIGGGEGYQDILDWVKNNQLEDSIELLGPVYDEKIVSSYFNKAIICISPNQAGLSVQKSMGYGVPFITNKNAYTGGEIFDIENGVNGIKYSNNDELLHILVDAATNKNKYIVMGENAKKYYDKNRTPEHMANVVLEAIDYVLH